MNLVDVRCGTRSCNGRLLMRIEQAPQDWSGDVMVPLCQSCAISREGRLSEEVVERFIATGTGVAREVPVPWEKFRSSIEQAWRTGKTAKFVLYNPRRDPRTTFDS